MFSEADGGDGLCYSCYHSFYRSMRGLLNSDDKRSEFVSICGDDAASSPECMSLSPVTYARDEFRRCTGGFDILFQDHKQTWTRFRP